MKYEDLGSPHWCSHCEQEVQLEMHEVGNDTRHYAKAVCTECGAYYDWIRKPQNEGKRGKASRFTPSLGYCEICGRSQLGRKEVFEIHHKIPVSEGGQDERINILELCTPCHRMCHFLRVYLNQHLSLFYKAYNEAA